MPLRPLLLALLAGLLGLLACQAGGGGGGKQDGGEEPPPVDPRPLVEVVPVVRGEVGRWLAASGTVESEAQADVIPEASGRVVAIHAEEGDAVRRGQLLAVLENPSLDAAHARAQAEYDAASAEVERLEALLAQGAVSHREVAEARRRLEVAEATLEEASRTLAHTRLVAPIAGTVAARNVRLGEVVSPPAAAFQVVDLQRLRVVVPLPEGDLPLVAVGQPARLESAYDPGRVAEAEVVRVAPVVDPRTGTVRVTLGLPPDQSALRPGQYVSADIRVGMHRDVLVVPRRALVHDGGATFVYRVRVEEETEEERRARQEREVGGKPGGRADEEAEPPPEPPGPRRIARRVEIEVGYTDDELAEVRSGLEEGEAVVVVGHANLRDGARVRLPGDPVLGAEAPGDEAAADDEAASVDAGAESGTGSESP